MPALRWFPFARAEGAHNMAADDVLLHSAAFQGLASLRFYGWASATVSLGYFQAAEVRKPPSPLSCLSWVRRPSGGKTLVHHHELTYALALPAGFQSGWMTRMHRDIILPALNRLGLSDQIQAAEKEPKSKGEILCFEQQTLGDLVCAGHKVVGSAQRKYRQALLQHGAILLAQSEHVPRLPGINELTGVNLSELDLQEAIVDVFQEESEWEARQAQWGPEEENAIHEKAIGQYGTAEWNEKR